MGSSNVQLVKTVAQIVISASDAANAFMSENLQFVPLVTPVIFH